MKGAFYGRKIHTPGIMRLIFFLTFVCFAAWTPFYNVYLKDLGFTYSQVGQIAGTMSFCTVFFTLIWGFLADKYGRKKILLIILLASSLLIPGFLVKGNYWYFLFFTFAVAIFYTPIGSIVDSFGVDMVNNQNKGSYGGFRMWASIGWAVTSVIVGWLIKGRDMRIIFIIGSVVLFITFVISNFGLNNTHNKDEGSEINLQNFKKLLSDKKLLIFLIIMMLYGVAAIPIFSLYNLYLQDLGADNKTIGFAFFVQSVFEFPMFLWGDKIVKRFGARKIFLFALAVSAIRLFIYSQTNNIIVPISLSAVHGFSYSLAMVSSVSIISEIIPKKWISTGQSLLWAFYMGAGMTLGYQWVGILSDMFSMKTAVFIESIFCFILILFTFLVFYFQRKKNQSLVKETRDLGKDSG